jgi:hypothetical protein
MNKKKTQSQHNKTYSNRKLELNYCNFITFTRTLFNVSYLKATITHTNTTSPATHLSNQKVVTYV